MVIKEEALVLHHWHRADVFTRGMKQLAGEKTDHGQLSCGLTTYGNAVALLAVHSAISLADAIPVACTGSRFRGDNHNQAPRQLKKLCGKQGIESDGVAYFEKLVAKKSAISYEDNRLTEKDLRAARNHAEGFRAWAFRAFPELARKGSGS